jgi:NAD(P)-dependent dehydrogenase (short-subunit alcohol dehydrogenase family)
MKGHFATTRAACAYWRDQQKAGKPISGRIINTSSGAGLFGNGGQANYSAAKAGIAAFTITVAIDMARYGVTCNCIAPAASTRLMNTVRKDPNVSETPDEPDEFDPMHPHNIAPLIVYLASDDAQWITGQVFDITGGSLKLIKPWHYVASMKQDKRFEVEELPLAMRRLFGTMPLGAPLMVQGGSGGGIETIR